MIADAGSPRTFDGPFYTVAPPAAVATDGAGNAMAVWREAEDEARRRIRVSRFTIEDGWSEPEDVTDGGGWDDVPRVAMDAEGNAIVIWARCCWSVWAKRYSVRRGWSAAEVLQPRPSSCADLGTSFMTRSNTLPRVAMSASGHAVVSWVQVDLPCWRQTVWVRRFDPGAGWLPAESIGTDRAWPRTAPELAINGTGDAIVAWREADFYDWPDDTTLKVSRGTVTGAWTLEEDLGPASSAKVAMDPAGRPLVVWTAGTRGVMAALFDQGEWAISSPGRPNSYDPSVAVGESDVFVLWHENPREASGVWSSRLAGTAWTDTALIQHLFHWNIVPAGYSSETTVLIWRRPPTFLSRLWAFELKGDQWTEPHGIDAEVLARQEAAHDDPAIARSPDGTITVVWTEYASSRATVWAIRYARWR